MKKLITPIVFAIIALGCNSSNSNNNVNPNNQINYSIDPNLYFKISFSGKNLATYGVKSTYYLFSTPESLWSFNFTIGGFSTTTTNINGIPYTENIIKISGSTFNTGYTQYNLHSDLNAQFVISRDGNVIGSDYSLVSWYYHTITDINIGNKQYDIDTAGFHLQVSSVSLMPNGGHNIAVGTFSCNLIDGSTKIPATGSFSLYTN